MQIPSELGEKIEDMVFGQLKNSDPDLTSRSLNRIANFKLFSKLLGTLSIVRFSTVSDRFISEIGAGKRASTMNENKLEMMISAMEYLKLQIYPMPALEETVDFLEIAQNLFQNSQGKIKNAFAKMFIHLLDPIAKIATDEVNLPAWYNTIELLYPDAIKMTAKPKPPLWLYAFLSTLLCVSRRDFFLRNWTAFYEDVLPKLSERGSKGLAVKCISRLTWVYLFRCWESPASVMEV